MNDLKSMWNYRTQVMASLFSLSASISALLLAATPSALVAETPRAELSPLSLKGSIIVDNRVLASVRGHAITVYDIMKKLDMVFYRQFPEYRSSPEARLEFYRSNWRFILNDAIDRELAMAYAEDKQFLVSNGDIREELEEMFGPNVMVNLYDAGLSLYDVQEMLRADILLRRLLSFFVRAPVMASITPEKLRAIYEEQIEPKASKKDGAEVIEEWTWQSISLTPKNGAAVTQSDADKVYELLMTQGIPAEELSSKLESAHYDIAISQPFSAETTAIAPAIVDAIKEVPFSHYSRPVSTASRNNQNVIVWKFYKLIDRKSVAQQELSFSDVESQLREQVAAPLIAQKTKEFFSDLKKQYGVHLLIPEQELNSFEPFHLSRIRS